jgi:catechol-2,3-dioxygenase
MNKSNRRIKGLGEVSIRVNNLDAMHKFYEEVIGLEVIGRGESEVFFKIAEGYAGHTQNLALFRADNRMFLQSKSLQLNPEQSTLHHIALNIALEDFKSEKSRLEGLGVKVNATVHEWLHIRSMYFSDPEGNLLEFVCYDASVK